MPDTFGLTPEERSELLPSGRQSLLQNRIHWAKFYLSKAGLIASPGRGRFVATEAGRKVLADHPSRIDVAYLTREPSFREFYKRDEASPGDAKPEVKATPLSEFQSTPEERIEIAYADLHATLRRELLERIAGNTPAFFERLIVDLLVGMGYGGTHKNAARQLGGAGDGGVDGVINEDRLGLDRVYVQAKRYAVGNAGRSLRCPGLRRQPRRPRRNEGRFRHDIEFQRAGTGLRPAPLATRHPDRRPDARRSPHRARRRGSDISDD